MTEELANILDNAEDAIERRDAKTVAALCEDLHPADLAELYEDLDLESRNFLIELLGSSNFAEVIPELPDTLVEETLNRFEPTDQREMLGALPDDDLVDILQDVSDSKRGTFLGLLDEETQEDTRILLRYNEESAGGRMTTQIGRILANMTVKEAIEHLRDDLESTGTLARIFVVDLEDKLIGKIRLRDLAFNAWDV